MISLVLAESALEVVPHQLANHPSVLSQRKKIGKYSGDILLDNSYHYAAMKNIPNELKRGRPDLIHFSILEATSIPLYFEDKIKVYIHTIDDKVIYIGKNVRIPKSYHRFVGLMEKLFSEKKIFFETNLLLEVKEKSFSELIKELKPSQTIGLTTKGKPSSYEKICNELENNACLVIGGFQKGHFSDSIDELLTKTFSIDPFSLETHVVVSRMLYEYEKTVFM